MIGPLHPHQNVKILFKFSYFSTQQDFCCWLTFAKYYLLFKSQRSEVKLVCDDKSDFIYIGDDLIKSAGILYDTNRHLL